MTTTALQGYSEQMADAVAAVAPSVVQVNGGRRPASGIVYGADVVVTMARVLGREDGVGVKGPDGTEHSAELAGWDPTTGVAVLRVSKLDGTSAAASDAAVRVGNLALAVARSWSNALTASAGIVAVIGGPLRTGRRRSVEQILRTTAPMHDGFAGGALVDASGRLTAIATATSIRGLGVAIPVGIAWKAAADILAHGGRKTGFLGIAGQQARLSERQRSRAGREEGLLVAALTPGSPADAAGVVVGDVILQFDRQPIHSADDLLNLLAADRVGRTLALNVLRGEDLRELNVTVGERPAS